MSMGEVRDCLFDMREIAQGFPCMLRIIIAFPVNQVFQPVSLLLRIDDIIYFILLIPILCDV